MSENKNQSPEVSLSRDGLRQVIFQVMAASDEMKEYKDDKIRLQKSKYGDLNLGMGVFAARDIGAGEYITTFPVHWVVLIDGEKREFGACRKLYGDDCDYEELIKSGYLNKLADYSMGVLEDLTIIADPQFCIDNRLIGHYINDLSFIPFKEYDDSKRNVAFKVLDIFATRDIKEGEELSLCYGPDYWDEIQEETSRRQRIEKEVSGMMKSKS